MIKVEVTGLDKVMRELNDAQRALKSLDGVVAELKINPNNPESIQEAIQQMETAVDSKVSPYGSNKLVSKLVKAAKEHYRNHILNLVNEHQQKSASNLPQ